MAKLESKGTLDAQLLISLSEEEAAALDALAGYEIDHFLKTFYHCMGEAYLRPHEAGLRSLFKALQQGPCSVRDFLGRARNARRVLDGVAEAMPRR